MSIEALPSMAKPPRPNQNVGRFLLHSYQLHDPNHLYVIHPEQQLIDQPVPPSKRSQSANLKQSPLEKHQDTLDEMRYTMWQRYEFDKHNNPDSPQTLPPALGLAISSLYGVLGEHTIRLREQRSYFTDDGPRGNFTGMLSEATILALLTRGLRGDDQDHGIIQPATQQQDKQGFDAQGYNLGFDIRVIDRKTYTPVDVQVKTSEGGGVAASAYHPSILTISLGKLSDHGKGAAITTLQNAIVAELDGTSTPHQEYWINRAEHQLLHATSQHRDWLSNDPAMTDEEFAQSDF